MTEFAPDNFAFFGDFKTAHATAMRFNRAGGKNGRIASIPDILDLRMHWGLENPAWTRYFQTMSAEFVGKSRGGVPIAIVTHGKGPLTTLAAIEAAYVSRGHQVGARISQDTFLDLEAGKFGDVEVIDMLDVWASSEYPFYTTHNAEAILAQPLFRARLGPNAEAYVKMHTEIDVEHQKEVEAHSRQTKGPCILGMGVSSGCYGDRQFFYQLLDKVPNTAFGHLLSITQIRREHSEDGDHLSSEVGTLSDLQWVRLLAIRGEEQWVGEFPDYGEYLANPYTLETMWRPARFNEILKFPWRLIEYGDHCFTTALHKGHEMQESRPQYLVKSKELVSEQTFGTEVQGYYGFFRYDPKDVWSLAPGGANCFSIGDVGIAANGTRHTAQVRFYHAKVDVERRVLTSDEVGNDYDLQMGLYETFAKTSALTRQGLEP